MVWTRSPHGHAICSGVCSGKDPCLYLPVKACPAASLYYYSIERGYCETGELDLASRVGGWLCCGLRDPALISAFRY